MKKLSIRLSDEEAARLDAIRARMGLRSEVAVIRQWIADDISDEFAAELAARPYQDEHPRVIDHGTQITAGPANPHLTDEAYKVRVEAPYTNEDANAFVKRQYEADHGPAEIDVVVPAVPGFQNDVFPLEVTATETPIAPPTPRFGVTSVRLRQPRKRQRTQRRGLGFPG